jgi:hypothetical protein
MMLEEILLTKLIIINFFFAIGSESKLLSRKTR